MTRKIAIIEDEQPILEMYQLKFEAEKYTVVTAKNGKDGLAIIEKSQPDIVLLDLMMPEMTGEEMLKRLRATDWGKDIPVVLMTNVGEYQAPKDLGHLGIAEYIEKARFTPKQVVEIVKRNLKR